MTTTAYLLEGLTCAACVAEVMEGVHAIPEVDGVAVALVRDGRSPLFIRSDGSLPLEAVRATVERCGFHVAVAGKRQALRLKRTFTSRTSSPSLSSAPPASVWP